MKTVEQKLVDLLTTDWSRRLKKLASVDINDFLSVVCPVYVIIENESDRDFVKERLMELSPGFCEKFNMLDGKNAFILGKGIIYQVYEFLGDEERFPVFVVGCREIGENLMVFPCVSILRLKEFYELSRAAILVEYINILFSVMMYNLLITAERYLGYRLCFLGVYDRNDFLQKKEVYNFVNVLGMDKDELKRILTKEIDLEVAKTGSGSGDEYDNRMKQRLRFLLRKVDPGTSCVLLSDFVVNVHWHLEKKIREWMKENNIFIDEGLGENLIEEGAERDMAVEMENVEEVVGTIGTKEAIESKEEKKVKKKGKR